MQYYFIVWNMKPYWLVHYKLQYGISNNKKGYSLPGINLKLQDTMLEIELNTI